MGIYLADQTADFLRALLLGAALGVVYDVFRVLRIAFPQKTAFGRLAIFIEDLLFFTLCAAATFVFLMGAVQGRIRFFLLLGEGLGAVIYYFTVGSLVMKVAQAIIDGVRRVLAFMGRWLVMPLWNLTYRIVELICAPFVFMGELFKKSALIVKIHLKIRGIVLYNQFTRLRNNITRERTKHGKGKG
jgi:spore cortex biosynthesis protein YabQ